ncbi:MAG: phage integrase N-terminal SAM-like domain-containing protein, partial [Chloroflexi bacterium]|nr:phage integrase N-terminal SAM-like domain-containing protein [Chloroflexota bacterium]
MNTACGSRDFLRGFRLSLIVEGLATSTIDHYYRDTSRFCDYLGDRPPSGVSSGDVTSYLAEFGATHSAKTTREAQLAAVRDASTASVLASSTSSIAPSSNKRLSIA